MENNSKKPFSFLNLVPHLIRFIIYSVLGTLIFLLVFYLYDNGPNIQSATDGLFVSGACLLACSIFTFLFNYGYFDLFAYGFSLFPSLFNKEVTRKYKDLYEYKETKVVKRKYKSKNYISSLICGILFLIASIICLLILQNSY